MEMKIGNGPFSEEAGFAVYHHGAVNGVTGSCHELRFSDGRSVLVDCGLLQGRERSVNGISSEALGIKIPVDGLARLVVTHVHLDHVGRIPYLLAAGFRGPIFCSEASALLLPLVLEDALTVGFTRNASLISLFLDQIWQKVVALPYKQWRSLGGGSWVKLHPAGHILGSAYVEVKIQVSEVGSRGTRRDWRVVFSGDLGAPHTPLLPAPKSRWRADLLVLESTYGDRLHEKRAQRKLLFRQAIEHALANRGTILVPAFSIGRTQELLYDLERLIYRMGSRRLADGGRWDQLEVVVDSPLAAKMTNCYRKLRHLWDNETRRRFKSGRHPLSFEQLYTVESHAEHLQTVDYLARSGRSALVIAASGMCTDGRVLNYLKSMLGDPRHSVLFVGYQAAGTPGRCIQKYGPAGGYVDLDGERYPIRAKVRTVNGYSAHADQAGLLRFVKGIRHYPREVRLVHGGKEAKQELRRRLQCLLPGSAVVIA